MVSANKHHLPSSSSKPLNPKNPNPNPSSDAEMKNPTATAPDSAAIVPLSVDGSDRDAVLRQSEFLTREEVLRRRSRRLKQLSGYYRAQYWALMDEVRIKYREYYWEYGKSPCEEEEGGGWESGGGGGTAEGSGENGHRLGLGFGEKDGYKRCGSAGCKTKAMALTSFCHQHILSDPEQKLYKACTYVVKSAQSGPVICGKPVIRAAVPALCTVHFQKAQRHVSQALKKAGFSGSSSNKPAPKFHVIIAEYVRQIQAKRKEAQKTAVVNVVVKEEHVS
ncbi:hypothetical protein MRB53_004374 [Persea americana]|uniref:Uncharacterized protein n=1 Tax=Persea americana TaxID=3435 RepID=A0ACC2MA11_PERAE|nr:hypothetical protein MRB53_004374 [Persea americana]